MIQNYLTYEDTEKHDLPLRRKRINEDQPQMTQMLQLKKKKDFKVTVIIA